MKPKKYKVTVKHAFDKKYLYKKCTSLYSVSCLSHVHMVLVHSAAYQTVSVRMESYKCLFMWDTDTAMAIYRRKIKRARNVQGDPDKLQHLKAMWFFFLLLVLLLFFLMI